MIRPPVQLLAFPVRFLKILVEVCAAVNVSVPEPVIWFVKKTVPSVPLPETVLPVGVVIGTVGKLATGAPARVITPPKILVPVPAVTNDAPPETTAPVPAPTPGLKVMGLVIIELLLK